MIASPTMIAAAADFEATSVLARPTGQDAGTSVFARPLAPLATAAAVTLLTLLAISAFRTADLVAALWAANAVAVGVWLRSGRGLGHDLSFGAIIAFGVLAGQLLGRNHPTTAIVFTVANMAEIILAVILARRFAPTLNLATVNGACRFFFSAAVAAPIAGGLVAAVGLYLLRETPALMTFKTWWFGHALGLAVIAPCILAADRRTLRALLNPWRGAETVLLFGLLGVVCAAVHFVLDAPLGFALIPVLILIAARLRIAGVTAALVIISVSAMGSLLLGAGPWRFVIGDLGERALLVQLTLLFGYVPIILVASLLEERDRLSERARAGQMRAEEASSAKSRLLANVAHEIKSPIAGVIGIGDLWLSGQLGPVTRTQTEMAAMLIKTARQVEALSHDLLDVARAESGAVKVELRPTDVPGLLEDARRAAILRPEAGSMAMKVVCEGDGLVAIADSRRLAQVIDNLATNAVKYARAGGEVIFLARRAPGAVRIEVVDRGPGLSPEKQLQLFEPFNRLGLERSAVEGHGIGLALARRLVELQGGSIGVDSTPGEGSTFWIELPAA